MIHTVSTGYAGLLGAMLRFVRKRPSSSPSTASTPRSARSISPTPSGSRTTATLSAAACDDDVSYFRRLWIRFFEGLGRMAYAAADPIIALYEGNRLRQMEDGAEEVRTAVIPNGIDLDALRGAPQAARPQPSAKVLGLIGRVVPIKDIKTFVRAMRTVVHPHARGRRLDRSAPRTRTRPTPRSAAIWPATSAWADQVKFLGFQKPDDILPKLGLMVLTSISEALPLVLLEATRPACPPSSTDVGSCRELVEGPAAEDRALGHSGAIVAIADPEATAGAALELLGDPEALGGRAGGRASPRVERFYTQKMMFDALSHDLRDALEGRLWQGSASSCVSSSGARACSGSCAPTAMPG